MEPVLSFSNGIIITLIVLSIIVLVLFIFIGMSVVRKIFFRPDFYGMSREELHKQWNTIEQLARRGDELSLKMAVMEADKLLDHALKSMNFAGATLGERLKLACYRYPKLKSVWSAHAVRNKLVHEASYRLRSGSARNALGEFKKALAHLGIL